MAVEVTGWQWRWQTNITITTVIILTMKIIKPIIIWKTMTKISIPEINDPVQEVPLKREYVGGSLPTERAGLENMDGRWAGLDWKWAGLDWRWAGLDWRWAGLEGSWAGLEGELDGFMERERVPNKDWFDWSVVEGQPRPRPSKITKNWEKYICFVLSWIFGWSVSKPFLLQIIKAFRRFVLFFASYQRFII